MPSSSGYRAVFRYSRLEVSSATVVFVRAENLTVRPNRLRQLELFLVDASHHKLKRQRFELVGKLRNHCRLVGTNERLIATVSARRSSSVRSHSLPVFAERLQIPGVRRAPCFERVLDELRQVANPLDANIDVPVCES